MVREMSAVMSAIVVAGQTGAAFAAELGTMRVTEEIDALTTLDIDPMEFLVVPRVLALSLMLPLLTVYADLVAILGGALVAIGMLGITASQYMNETIKALFVSDLAGGVGKALLYGALVGFAGCYHGLHAGSGAAAVGRATTSAVVSGIVLVILAAGILAVVFHVIGV
jgi:phospholipid/cholesterol/gamma-HCH transport system permease protein